MYEPSSNNGLNFLGKLAGDFGLSATNAAKIRALAPAATIAATKSRATTILATSLLILAQNLSAEEPSPMETLEYRRGDSEQTQDTPRARYNPKKLPEAVEIIFSGKQIPLGQTLPIDLDFPTDMKKFQLPPSTDREAPYIKVLNAFFTHFRASNFVEMYYQSNHPDLFSGDKLTPEHKKNIIENLTRFLEVFSAMDNLEDIRKIPPECKIVGPAIFGAQHQNFLSASVRSYSEILKQAQLYKIVLTPMYFIRQPMLLIKESNETTLSEYIAGEIFKPGWSVSNLDEPSKKLLVEAYCILNGYTPEHKFKLEAGKLERIYLPFSDDTLFQFAGPTLRGLFKTLERFPKEHQAAVLAGHILSKQTIK